MARSTRKNRPSVTVENGRMVGPGIKTFYGPDPVFFAYQPNPFTYVPNTSDYFSLANYSEIAQALGQFSLVILPREVLFNQGSTWTDGSTDATDVDYTWESTYGPRWKSVIAAVRTLQAGMPLSRKTRFFAYVPLGQRFGTDYSLTQAQIAKAVDEGVNASKLGCDGVFGDEGGYDFHANRVTHQNYLVDQCRLQVVAETNKGCVAMNAWHPLDVMGEGSDGYDATYNPGSVDPSFGGADQVGGGDVFVMESCPVNTSTSTSQYVTNYHIQNFRFTEAAQGIQGLNERVQNAVAGRLTRNVDLCALNFIHQSPSSEFYDRLAQAVCVMWSIEYLAISRTDAFEDFYPRPWTPLHWDQLLGAQGFYNRNRAVVTITNGGGSTKSGWSGTFERGTLSLALNPTLGIHAIFGPGFAWYPDMSPGQESQGDLALRPCDTVITANDANLTDLPDTSNGYPVGVIAQSQGGLTVDIGMRALSISSGNGGPWYAYNNVGGFLFMRRSGDFRDGMTGRLGAKTRITQGTYVGAEYEVTTTSAAMVGFDTLTWGRADLFYEYRDVWPASTVTPTTSPALNGADTETATNKLNERCVDYVHTSTTNREFSFVLPAEYVAGSSIRLKIGWRADAGSAAEVVRWEAYAQAQRDGSTIDSSYGSSSGVTDALQATTTQQFCTIDITPNGSPVGGDRIFVRLERDHDYSFGGPTALSQTAKWTSMQVRYQRTRV